MPSLCMSRSSFQVIWLPDGAIFAIGGNGTNTVEMLVREWGYDGNTSTAWRQVASMLNNRSSFAAIVVCENRILVAGGYGNNESVELFTPPKVSERYANGQWTAIELKTSIPESACSGIIADGIVLIFGKRLQWC